MPFPSTTCPRHGRVSGDPRPDAFDLGRAPRDERDDAGIGLDARSLLDLDGRAAALRGEVRELGGARLEPGEDGGPGAKGPRRRAADESVTRRAWVVTRRSSTPQAKQDGVRPQPAVVRSSRGLQT